jgi:hypothetical protein
MGHDPYAPASRASVLKKKVEEKVEEKAASTKKTAKKAAKKLSLSDDNDKKE